MQETEPNPSELTEADTRAGLDLSGYSSLPASELKITRKMTLLQFSIFFP